MTHSCDNTITITSDAVSEEIRIWFEWFSAERESKGIVHDIDLFAIVANRNGRISQDTDLVFYNNWTDSAHIIYFNDDSNYRHEDADDSININLSNATGDTGEIIIFAHLHDAASRKQVFSQLTSFCMYNNLKTKVENPVIFHELPSTEIMLLCEIRRINSGWLFAPTGIGYSGDLKQFLQEYGLNLE